MSIDVKTVVDQLNRDFEEFKHEHQQSLKENDNLLNEKVDRLNEALSELSDKADAAVKAEKLNALRDELGELKEFVHSASFKPADESEALGHTKAFFDWAVKGDRESEAALREYTIKAVSIGTATAGGHAVPAPIADEIFSKVLDFSPLVNAVRTTTVSTPLFERLVDVKGSTTGWSAEGGTRSTQTSPTIQQVTFTHGELYTVQQASNWSLQDILFDVEDWLVNAAAEDFAVALGTSILTGNGTSRPTGMVNTAPTSTDDDGASPERAFQTLQYVATGVAGGFQQDGFGSPQGHPFDCFLDLFSKFKPVYLTNAQFMMRRATEATLRKMHDVDRNYLWQPAIAPGLPNTLFGYPVLNNEDVAAVAADALAVIFGDYRRGYELIRLHGMSAIRDDVTSKGNTLFYLAQRYGGNVVNDDAIKCIKCAAS